MPSLRRARLTRRTQARAIGAALAAVGLVSCSDSAQDASSVKQLTNTSFPCHDFDADALQKVSSGMPSGFFRGFSQSDLQLDYQRMADIPAVYRNFMYDEYRRGVFSGVTEDDNLGGAVGVTWRGGGVTGYDEPSSMQIAANFAGGVNFALIHEMGHAVEGLVARQASAKGIDHESRKQQLFNSEAVSNPRLRDYARTQPAEFFAEAFNNFYCSAESQNFIKDELPNTYRYLASVLAPAPWSSGDADGGVDADAGTDTDEPDADVEPASILLGDGADDAHVQLYAGTSLSAENVYLCAEAQGVDCPATDDSWTMKPVRDTADRRILTAPFGMRVETDKVYSLTAYDADGHVVNRVSFRIKAG